MAHEIKDIDSEDEPYDENADEDFNPDTADGEGDASSSEDEEAAPAATAKPAKPSRKRKSEAAGVDELDSGDEATIQEQKKKKRRKEHHGEDEDSGAEGGFVRTRAQRLAEKVEKKQRRKVTDGEVTIDVEQMWADLSSAPVGRPAPAPPKAGNAMDVDGEADRENAAAAPAHPPAENELLTIKRRIEYAGEVTEITERVPRGSAEAQRYLASHPDAATEPASESTAPTLHRPLKRPSLFEPNPTATVKGVAPEKLRPRAPSRLDVVLAAQRAAEAETKRAERMTTVAKSAIDWRGFVESQAGLRGELEEYGKSKGGYLGREEFLGRAQAVMEGRGREARLRG